MTKMINKLLYYLVYLVGLVLLGVIFIGDVYSNEIEGMIEKFHARIK